MHHLFLALSLTAIFAAPCIVFVDPKIEEQESEPEQKSAMNRFHFTL